LLKKEIVKLRSNLQELFEVRGAVHYLEGNGMIELMNATCDMKRNRYQPRLGRFGMEHPYPWRGRLVLAHFFGVRISRFTDMAELDFPVLEIRDDN
jgi:hypothetical protein